jgi:hypothetical protein
MSGTCVLPAHAQGICITTADRFVQGICMPSSDRFTRTRDTNAYIALTCMFIIYQTHTLTPRKRTLYIQPFRTTAVSARCYGRPDSASVAGRARSHTHVIREHTRTHTDTRTHTHTYIHTDRRPHTHIHTHTYIHKMGLQWPLTCTKRRSTSGRGCARTVAPSNSCGGHV